MKFDMWSIGIIFYERLTGVHPFKKNDPYQTLKAIHTQYNLNLPDKIEIETYKIIKQLL
jgi:serine/threonine protein kinase